MNRAARQHVKRLAVAACACLLVAACATPEPAQSELYAARSRVGEARSIAGQYAPAEVGAADAKLARAEAAFRERDWSAARRLAEEAQAEASLALSAAQRERARRASAELAQSIDELRREREARAEEKYRAREAEEALARAKAAEEAQAKANRQLADEVRRLQAQVRDLEARQTQRGWVITVGSDLLFDVGRATLKPGGRRAIANLARIMRNEPERNIVIEGFTDSSGAEETNRRLSERRAQAVRDALVERGVAANRIVARGLGEAYPVASNSSPAGRQLNRRVEILIGEHAGRAATGSSSR